MTSNQTVPDFGQNSTMEIVCTLVTVWCFSILTMGWWGTFVLAGGYIVVSDDLVITNYSRSVVFYSNTLPVFSFNLSFIFQYQVRTQNHSSPRHYVK